MRRFVALLLSTLLFVTGLPAAVHATPASEKRAEAERARQAVAELDVKVEIAAEEYNEAYARYDALSTQVRTTEARIGELKSRIAVLEERLDQRIDHMYRNGPLGMLEVLLDTHSFSEFATVWDTLTDLSTRDASEAEELRNARAEAETAQVELREAQAAAKSELDAMAARKAEIMAVLRTRQDTLAGLEAEVAAIESEERTQEERAARAAQASARSSRSSSGSEPRGAPSNAPRSEVVDIAMRYLGSPYRWGASGPDAFDCSGFTMFVYAQVGVSLPHSSRAQYGSGERVSRAHLQPGDLVFFGRSRIHHVGIYVGGGQYIHSPRTGDVVRVSSMDRSDYAGAVRP